MIGIIQYNSYISVTTSSNNITPDPNVNISLFDIDGGILHIDGYNQFVNQIAISVLLSTFTNSLISTDPEIKVLLYLQQDNPLFPLTQPLPAIQTNYPNDFNYSSSEAINLYADLSLSSSNIDILYTTTDFELSDNQLPLGWCLIHSNGLTFTMEFVPNIELYNTNIELLDDTIIGLGVELLQEEVSGLDIEILEDVIIGVDLQISNSELNITTNNDNTSKTYIANPIASVGNGNYSPVLLDDNNILLSTLDNLDNETSLINVPKSGIGMIKNSRDNNYYPVYNHPYKITAQYNTSSTNIDFISDDYDINIKTYEPQINAELLLTTDHEIYGWLLFGRSFPSIPQQLHTLMLNGDGTPPYYQIKLIDGQIIDINLLTDGFGYPREKSTYTLNVSGGGGSNFSAILIDNMGVDVVLSNGGSYTTQPAKIKITGGGGIDAEYNITTSGSGPQSINSVTMVNHGKNYKTIPNILVLDIGDNIITSNTPAIFDIALYTFIEDVKITNMGSNYTSTPTFTITKTTIITPPAITQTIYKTGWVAPTFSVEILSDDIDPYHNIFTHSNITQLNTIYAIDLGKQVCYELNSTNQINYGVAPLTNYIGYIDNTNKNLLSVGSSLVRGVAIRDLNGFVNIIKIS